MKGVEFRRRRGACPLLWREKAAVDHIYAKWRAPVGEGASSTYTLGL